jgi:hypothetical protein
MGFLDNSGDIILDAVLTDTGRARLARADGSFQITKFALGDDEINYGSYNKNHPSGSAYYDLDILQTPVFEAFTNNSSVLKFKLQSISRTNLLYLPILKINNNDSVEGTPLYTDGDYLITCDSDTEIASITALNGVLKGASVSTGRYLVIDQGLDTTEISRTFTIDSDLKETQYLIEIDNRFGSIRRGPTPASLSYIDDDNIASYYVSSTDTFVEDILVPTSTEGTKSVLNGPTGTRLIFDVKASLELNSSTFLFTQLGTTATVSGVPCYAISTNIRVTGVTTGYSINIPVRFIKAQ